MKIKGIRQHLSIGTFDEMELPALTIVVGLNGSGKSHFLQAIENGAIATDVFQPMGVGAELPQGQTQIGLLRIESGAHALGFLDQRLPSSLVIQQQPPSSRSRRNPLPDILKQFDEYRAELIRPALEDLRHIIGLRWSDLDLEHLDVWAMGPEAVAARTGLTDRLDLIDEIFREADEILRRQPVSPSMSISVPFRQILRDIILAVAKRKNIPHLRVTANDARQLNEWGTVVAFDPNIVSLFSAYRDAHILNDWQRLDDAREGTQNSLSDEEFLEKFGVPPWVILSEYLKTFGHNYRIEKPSLRPNEPIGFSLKRLDDDVPVSYSGLSSGEKVLLRFALSLINYDPLRIDVSFPRLVLLDEMDSSLHPAMVHRWLNAISEGLVVNKGICCILTTHSPTTVALASEQSLYELRAGLTHPQKISK